MMRGLLISYLSPFLTEAPTVDSRGSGMTYNKAHNAQVMSLPHHDGFFGCLLMAPISGLLLIGGKLILRLITKYFICGHPQLYLPLLWSN